MLSANWNLKLDVSLYLDFYLKYKVLNFSRVLYASINANRKKLESKGCVFEEKRGKIP